MKNEVNQLKQTEVFKDYPTALRTGQQSYGHGNFFIDSEQRNTKGEWQEYVPEGWGRTI